MPAICPSNQRHVTALLIGMWLASLFSPSVGRAQLSEQTDRAAELSQSMQRDFGAATWIPEDAGFFSAGYRYGDQWRAFNQSTAFQEVLATPAAQMALTWIRQQPYLGQLQAARAQNPLIDQSVRLAQQAFAKEVFVYVDDRGPGFVNALADVYATAFWGGFATAWQEQKNVGMVPQREIALRGQMIRQMLEWQSDLRMPGVVFGFRLSDPKLGKDWITGIIPPLQQAIPFPLQKEMLGGGEYLTLRIEVRKFMTADHRAAIEAELWQVDEGQELAQELIEFLESQTLSIAVGMRGDYLLLSIGADNSHLEEFGKGTSLAESATLAPVRKVFRDDLVGLSYVDAALTNSGKIDVDETVAGLDYFLLDVKDHMPAGMDERLLADAESLLMEVNESLPEAQPTLAVSFWRDGFESFQFSALAPGSMESSQPLRILAHAGRAPLMAFASNSPPSLPNFRRLAFWIQRAYGYCEELLEHHLTAEEWEKFRDFQSLALPTIRDLHDTTFDLLIPALDGGQSVFLMDAKGAFTHSPDDKSPLPQPIRFPRPAMVFEVQDAEKLVAACIKYREIFNQLMRKVQQQNPDVQPFQLPAPTHRTMGDATLYNYPIPDDYQPATYLNNDFEPHAMLTDRHLVLSLSPRQSQQLLTASPRPESAIIDWDQPSGRAAWFDFRVLTKLLGDDADAVLALLGTEQQIEPTTAMMVKVHVDKLRSALGALRSYQSRTYEGDGLQVTHSWLHIEDIDR